MDEQFCYCFFLKKIRPFPASFYFIFVFSIQLIINKCSIKFCWWLESNRGSLVSKATALPTEPQPLPKLLFLKCHINYNNYMWTSAAVQLGWKSVTSDTRRSTVKISTIYPITLSIPSTAKRHRWGWLNWPLFKLIQFYPFVASALRPQWPTLDRDWASQHERKPRRVHRLLGKLIHFTYKNSMWRLHTFMPYLYDENKFSFFMSIPQKPLNTA